MCPNDEPPPPAKNNKVATLIFCWVNLFISVLQKTFIAEKWHVSSPRTFAILKSSPFCALLCSARSKNLMGMELLKVLTSIFFPALLPSHSWLFSTYLTELCRAPSANTVQIIHTVQTNRCLSHHPTDHLRDAWHNSSPSSVGKNNTMLQAGLVPGTL